MSAYKKLNQQDAYITTYTARKSWIASGSQYSDLGILNIVGLSGSNAYIPAQEDLFYGGGVNSSATTLFNRKLIYKSTHHLYYSLFNNGVVTTTGSYDNFLQSSFEVSGSRYLNNHIAVFSLPKELYGTHIEPFSVSILPDLVSGSDDSGSLDNYIVNNYCTDAGVDSYDTADNLYIENVEFLFGTTGGSCNFIDLDYITNESTYVNETPQGGGQYLDTTATAKNCNEIVDDGEGRLYFKYSVPRVYVGNVIYPHGQLIITDDIVAKYYNHYFNAVLRWKSNLPIYTHNYHCRIKSGELNYTLNKTALNTTSGQIADLVSGSNFNPYFTTVGLYNDSNELVAVAKMAQPVQKSSETDMVVQVKLDMNFGINRLLNGRVTAPAPICTHYFTFRNLVQIIGQGINTNSSPTFYDPSSKRRVKDDGTYQLYLKKGSSILINKDVQGVTDKYHLVKQRRGNNSQYRSYCYVDVVATGNTTIGFNYQITYNYLPFEDTSNKRNEEFFINILEQYLYESNLDCGYRYQAPISTTLPYSINGV